MHRPRAGMSNSRLAMIAASMLAFMPSNYTASSENRYRRGTSAFTKQPYETKEYKKRKRKIAEASRRRNRR